MIEVFERRKQTVSRTGGNMFWGHCDNQLVSIDYHFGRQYIKMLLLIHMITANQNRVKCVL